MTPVPAIIGQRYDPHIPVDQLTEHPANPNEGDEGAVCESLDAHGFYGAVLVQESTGIVFAGNTRLRSARSKGMTGIPGFWCQVDDDTRDRILSVDNEATRKGRNDESRLVALLTGLAQQPRGLEGTGFDGDDLDALIAALSDGQGRGGPADGDPDDVPEPPAIPVTQPGDIWILGPHRIICGDCRDFGTVEKLLAGERVNVAFTSPPYASQRAYDESSGFRPIPPGEYVDWFEDVQSGVRAVLESDGSWIINILPGAEDRQRRRYVLDLIAAHLDRWGWRFTDEYCWPRAGMPLDPKLIGRFKIGFEMLYVFTGTEDYKFRPDEVRHESDHVFAYEGVHNRVSNDYQGTAESSSRRKAKTDQHGLAYPSTMLPTFGNADAIGHSAAFPVGLPAWFMKVYSDPGDTVFDPFMGSGSTLIAAHQENRTAYGCEISGSYCDVILKRFETLTGIKPERVLPDGATEPVSFTGGPP